MSNLELGFDLDLLLNKGQKNFSKTKYHRINKDGTYVYRILPSFSETDRRLNHTYHVHWITDSTGRSSKVECTYHSEKYCPLCEKHREAKTALEQVLLTDPKGSSDNARRLSEVEQGLRPSKSVYYNAVSAGNEVVVLEVTKTVSDLLDKKIAEAVQKRGFDPTNLRTGVYFEFVRLGKGRDAVTVDLNKTTRVVDGESADFLNRNPLSEELIAALPGLVADIHNVKVVGIKQYSGKQLADFLRGKPLEELKNESAPARTESVNSQIQQQSAPAPAVEVQASVAQAAPAQEAAAQAAEPAQVVAPNTKIDYAAQAARLRGLTNK